MNNLKDYAGRKGEIVRHFRANPSLGPAEVAKRFNENVGNIYLCYKLAHGVGWREAQKLEKREGFGGHIKASTANPTPTAAPPVNKIVAYFIDHPNASPDLVAKKFGVAPITVHKMRKLAQETMAQQVRAGVGNAHLDVEIPVAPVTVAAAITTCQKSANETQVGGSHYKEVGVQPWDAMEAWLTREEFVGFLKGNIIKYMARSRLKGGDEDIKKASHYSAKLNEIVERTV